VSRHLIVPPHTCIRLSECYPCAGARADPAGERRLLLLQRRDVLLPML
jgi:hypothetical protein